MVLPTKLHVPSAAPQTLSRARLTDRIEQGIANGSRLTLVVAPPGSGKTTLLSNWLALHPRLTSWVALDEQDNLLPSFLLYLVEAWKPLPEERRRGLRDLLGNEQAPPTAAVLGTLLLAIPAQSESFVFVLDDYHVLQSEQVNAAVTFLLDHAPPAFHLVITSRTEPTLPLGRLRVRRQLTELGNADLRFSLAEAETFLQRALKEPLSSAQVAVLTTRTEGWIAGLQLAALGLQGGGDVAGFIARFGGSNRYITDYLLDEVLDQQPPEVQRFLLETAVLSRMCGPLCNALRGRDDGQQLLERLEKANLFIVPLDEERRWYRYHHLFGDLLRHRLRQTPTIDAQTLHSRAAVWFMEAAYSTDAIQHAIASRDVATLEQVLPTVVEQAILQNQLLQMEQWLDSIPTALIQQSITLQLQAAWMWALLEQGERAHQHLEFLAATLTETTQQGQLAALQAAIAWAQGHMDAVVEHSTHALPLLGDRWPVMRNIAEMLLGRALMFQPGHVEPGMQHVRAALAEAHRLHNRWVSHVSLATIVFVLLGMGRLRDAQQLLNQFALHYDRQASLQSSLGWLHGLRATIHYLHNDLVQAHHEVALAQQNNPLGGMQYGFGGWVHVVEALLLAARGDHEEALAIFDQLEAAQVELPPTIRSGPFKVNLLLHQGKLAEAMQWARAEQLAPGDTITGDRDDLYLGYARVLTAEGRYDEAATVLTSLQHLEANLGMQFRLVTIYLLQAIMLLKRQHRSEAISFVKQAVLAAAPERMVRAFLDEDHSIASILAEARSLAPTFVDELQRAYRITPSAPASSLVEPLTEREIEVLQLIAQGLSNREIGEQLVLAVGTVKRHAVNIFGKLQVQNRTEAAARARELQLL